MPSIEVIQGPDKGRTFEITGNEALIGRQSETAPLNDGTVSRLHARLSQRGKAWVIEDIGSVNGTFLNGTRVTKATRIHQGDQIRCGTTLLVYGGAPAGAPPLDIDTNGNFLDASIMATVPANDDSVIIPTPEAGAEAIDTLRVLYNLTSEIGSIFNVDQLAARTLDVIFDTVHADRGFVLSFGEDGELITLASRGREGADSRQIPISRTIINEVASKQVGVLSSNAMRDKRFSSGKSVHDYGIRSAICVPIKGREKTLGVIHVDSSVSEVTYSTEQLRLLTAVGYQTGLAIENVRLYEAAIKSERLAAVGETLAALSHHIKNILQGLGGGTDVVERALDQGDLERARKSWPIVRRSYDRINGVILNMLAYSKPRQTILEPVAVNHVVEECVALVTPQADEKAVAIITDLPDVPILSADPGGLHQAVLNLLNNALDAVAPQTGAISVSTGYDSLQREIAIRVADNGVGIPPSERDRIFEAFHTTKGQKGTGLGLAVAKKVVRDHGGRITVDSTPGHGATFTIVLPLHQPAPKTAADTHAP